MSARGAVVWVDGADAASFLHGLLSNDIAALSVGAAIPALLLDGTGHIRVAVRVIRTGDAAFTLLTDAAAGERLADLLEEYHFSEEIEIIGPEPVDVVTFSRTVDPVGADLVLAGDIPDTVDAVGQAEAILAATAGDEIPSEMAEALRVAAGVPRFGVDMTERTLVHEAGLQTSAVSFDKGCYLGQETVARVEYRGGVNRRLTGLRLPAAARVGAEVRAADRVVGTVTSTATHPVLGPIALAVLRKEAGDGDAVSVDGLTATATVVALPMHPDPPDR